MTTKEMTYQYRSSQWSELVKERVELGLSIRAYCAKKGFAENTYFYWQRRLRETARTQVEAEQASFPSSSFVEVVLSPASAPSLFSCITILLRQSTSPSFSPQLYTLAKNILVLSSEPHFNKHIPVIQILHIAIRYWHRFPRRRRLYKLP